MNKQGKLLCIKQCSNCGKNVEIRHKQRLERDHIFCNKKCEVEFKSKAKINEPDYFNCICPTCGKSFHKKPSLLDKSLNHYCSMECHRKAKMEYMKGKGNHQYGIKGKQNSSWKSDKRITTYGYIKIRKPNHPFKDCDGFVLEHRLIAEKYLLTNENSIEINGVRYLNPKFDVHHINKNKTDNRIENLIVLTKSEHRKLHAKDRNCKKVDKLDLNGKYIRTYNSIKEAGIENKIYPQNINSVCKGNSHTAGGFKWRYSTK